MIGFNHMFQYGHGVNSEVSHTLNPSSPLFVGDKESVRVGFFLQISLMNSTECFFEHLTFSNSF